VYGERCDQEDDGQRQAREWDKRTEEYGDAAEQLSDDGAPRHEVRSGHTERLQDGRKFIRPSYELGNAMHEEAIPNDES
jgi:hypothetical protein